MSGNDANLKELINQRTQELRASEARFHNIVSITTDGIVIVDGIGMIIFANAAATSLFGRNADKLLGEPFGFPIVAGETTELDIANSKRRSMIAELRVIATEWEGKPACLATLRDITDRKRAEEEILRLNTELAARAAELEAANKELEAFNYSVAHDLRQPLNTISGNCQAIQMICGDQLQEDCKSFLEGAYNGTLRMNLLIEALLNFSKLGRVEPQREMVNLSDLVHAVVQDLKLAQPERQVDFRVADEVVAYGDASLLRVVLVNLFGNAWKYSGIREKAVIEFGVIDLDGVPAYFVRDNGAGFDMTDAHQLFIPFRRLPGAEATRGFGIGLATVERIIARHGGKIWAEGAPGNGACFYFTLSSPGVSK